MWHRGVPLDKLKQQLREYKTLKITQSYRGQVVLIMSALLAYSLVLGYFGAFGSVKDVLISLVIYVPILIFIYRGHRWALIVLFVLWTIEKLATLIIDPIGSIIFYLLISVFIYRAYLVETERRKNGLEKSGDYGPEEGASFCSQCGEKLFGEANFCQSCGEGV